MMGTTGCYWHAKAFSGLLFLVVSAYSDPMAECDCENTTRLLPGFAIGTHIVWPPQVQVGLDLAPCPLVYVQGRAAAPWPLEASFVAGLQFGLLGSLVIRNGVGYAWFQNTFNNVGSRRPLHSPHLSDEEEFEQRNDGWYAAEGVTLESQVLYFPGDEKRLGYSGALSYNFGNFGERQRIFSILLGLVLAIR
jgi:hypothetical protein